MERERKYYWGRASKSEGDKVLMREREKKLASDWSTLNSCEGNNKYIEKSTFWSTISMLNITPPGWLTTSTSIAILLAFIYMANKNYEKNIVKLTLIIFWSKSNCNLTYIPVVFTNCLFLYNTLFWCYSIYV